LGASSARTPKNPPTPSSNTPTITAETMPTIAPVDSGR
jgi:hypothetical protein